MNSPPVARPVAEIAVVGSGTMGAGIALSAAQAGYAVRLADKSADALGRGLGRIETLLAGQVAKGRISAGAAAQVRARVVGATDTGELGTADLVIEAVFEDLAVKQALFSDLATVVKAGAILATNTSTIDVDAIASASGRAADCVGMHFFSPAHVMRLLEVVRGRDTAGDVLASAIAVGQAMGKVAVVVGNCFGFVGNRMLYAYGREKEFLMLEGASPRLVDRALEAFGMAMGPNAVGDLAGLDIGYHARRAWAARPSDPRFYRIADALVESGRLGQKTGLGFYRYVDGQRHGQPDPAVDELIAGEAARLGIVRRQIDDEEIVSRCVLALVCEGARILEEGIASSAADIDTVWCNGYGFPRERGGPMAYADSIGLARVVETLDRYAGQWGTSYWAPNALLRTLAAHREALSGHQDRGSPEG